MFKPPIKLSKDIYKNDVTLRILSDDINEWFNEFPDEEENNNNNVPLSDLHDDINEWFYEPE